jgi:hypothetical protein
MRYVHYRTISETSGHAESERFVLAKRTLTGLDRHAVQLRSVGRRMRQAGNNPATKHFVKRAAGVDSSPAAMR